MLDQRFDNPNNPGAANYFDAAEVDGSIPERFERMAALFPDHPVARTDSWALSFAELNLEANRLAHLILRQLGPGEGVVAYLLEHEAPHLVAILGILKAGKACLPLEPDLPTERMAFMLGDTETGLFVTNDRNYDAVSALAGDGAKVINLDHLPASGPAGNPDLAIPPETPAMIFYTSGSTGEPKGVVTCHCSVLNQIRVNRLYTGGGIRVGDRMAQIVSCSFVYIVATTLAPALCGAVCLPFDIKKRGLAALADWLAREEIDIFCTVPSMMRQLAPILPADGGKSLPRLRQVVFGGEGLLRTDVRLLKERVAPACMLTNAYGSTEMHYVTKFLIEDETSFTGDCSPISSAVDGMEVLLWDDDGRPVAPGEVGEIVVRSKYLALGYWHRPEQTAAVFLPDPRDASMRLYKSGDLGRFLPDGAIMHLGRKDNMVKVRGKRIELGEVERALLAMEAVKEAVAVVFAGDQGKSTLVAHLVPVSGRAPEPKALRAFLAKSLPDYMIPSYFIIQDALPLNTHGKVDRRALASVDPKLLTKSGGVAPRTELERRLTQMLEDLLDFRPIGIRDDFFDLGGDSLAFLTLFAAIEAEWGIDLPMEEVLRAPTVEHLASILGSGTTAPGTARTAAQSAKSRWRNKFLHFSGGILALLPYRFGSGFLAVFGGLIFRRRKRLIDRCLAATNAFGPLDKAEVSRRTLVNNAWTTLRCVTLARKPGEFDRWVEAAGFAAFQESYRASRGVILISSHAPAAGLIPVWLIGRGSTWSPWANPPVSRR